MDCSLFYTIGDCNETVGKTKKSTTHSITAYGIIVYDFNFNSFVLVNNKNMFIFLSLEKAKQHLAYIVRRLYEKSCDHSENQSTDYQLNARGFVLKCSYEHLNRLRHKLKHIMEVSVVEKASGQYKLKEIEISNTELVERIASTKKYKQNIKWKRMSDGQHINY